tara:strand:- start:132 stop:356 length:225 start_codon:yes stop_codon:yes gene_type:complete
MDSKRVIAIATSVISISLLAILGLISFQIYNNPKNAAARCKATYLREIKGRESDFKYELGKYIDYQACLYKINN